MNRPFKNSVVLVTGASQGIGKAVAVYWPHCGEEGRGA
jgi:NADP-dependent 3-hydroxy acid dehydrogenase YdfG